MPDTNTLISTTNGSVRLTVEGRLGDVRSMLRGLVGESLNRGASKKARKWKLQPDQVREIRSRHAAGETYAALADEFGTCPETIENAVKRKTFRDIE